MKLSVVICSHNPRIEAIKRTLDSLRHQTLDQNQWDLIIVDNLSDRRISESVDVSWHKRSRVIVEPKLGLTHARICGIEESAGDVICFVDDDNVLNQDYLSESLRIGRESTHLGCWGGEISAEYEAAPEPWFQKYQGFLVIRPLSRDTWNNSYSYDDALPCGAGMCVRRCVAIQYRKLCISSTERSELDRRGNSFSSGGDLDMAYTAIDMGFGTGRFKALHLVHLIPESRLKLKYLLALAFGLAESEVYLNNLRDETRSLLLKKSSFKSKLFHSVHFLFLPRIEKKVAMALKRGRNKGLKNLSQ